MKSLVLYDDKYEKTSEIFISEVFLEAQTGFEPVNQGVADPRLTTWLCRRIKLNDPNEIRTRVTAVKGRCLNRLTMGPY